jgi:hypothetical protein
MYYVARWYDPQIGHFVQADTIVPGPMNPDAYNKYGYTTYNPLRYSDPTGHGLFDEIASFVTGAAVELVKDTMWWHPKAQKDLSASSQEPTSMLIGRLAVDVAGIVGGVTMITSGASIIGGGGAVCAITGGAGCAVVPATTATGAALVVAGAYVTVGAVVGAVDTGVALVNQFSNQPSSGNPQTPGGNSGLPSNYSFPRQVPDQNKLHHIFDNPDHNLGPVEQYFGGQQVAFDAVYDAYVNHIMNNPGISHSVLGYPGINIQVNQFNLTVRGTILSSGEIRISTFFIP